jgi:hypothetical protein
MGYLMRLLSIVILSFFLAACSSKPSDGDIEKAVNNYIQRVMPSQQCFKVKNVEKINGIDRNNGTYVVMVRWDMVSIRNFSPIEFNLTCLPESSDPIANLGRVLSDAAGVVLDVCGLKPLQTGDVCTFSMNVIFTKTENGWQ